MRSPSPRGLIQQKALSARRGARLGLLGMAMCYLFFLGLNLWVRGPLLDLGGDYRAYWASAEIARAKGFDKIYDLATQEQFQQRLLNRYHASAPGPDAVLPWFYPPAFVLPFLPFLLLDPFVGYLVWTVINLGVLLSYCRRLLSVADASQGRSILFKVVLSFPVFSTLFWGQVDIWLLVCVGEFMVWSQRGKNFLAGLWLGGLLIKPQLLPLLILGVLIGWRLKTLLGFSAAGFGIAAISIGLAGVGPMVDMARSMADELLSPGAQAVRVFAMTNWSAVAAHLALFVAPSLAWAVGLTGLVLTGAAAVYLWVLPTPAASPRRWAVVVLGTYAATVAVAWPSYGHNAAPMIAPLLYLWAKGWLPERIVNLWLLAPSVFFLGTAFTAGPGWANTLVGLLVFALDIFLLIWAVASLRRQDPWPSPQAAAG